jgi:hypothetical protein
VSLSMNGLVHSTTAPSPAAGRASPELTVTVDTHGVAWAASVNALLQCARSDEAMESIRVVANALQARYTRVQLQVRSAPLQSCNVCSNMTTELIAVMFKGRKEVCQCSAGQ